MRLIILSLFCFPFTLFAGSSMLNWNDITSGQKIELTQNIVLDSTIRMESGHLFSVDGIEFVESRSFYLIELNDLACNNQDLESEEMVFIRPEASDRESERSVGVSFNRGCKLVVFVDFFDFKTTSFFRPSL